MKSAEDFKDHLRQKHGRGSQLSSRTYPDKNTFKSNKLCVHWNRGHCRFTESTCRFVHKEIPACRYQENCTKYSCLYYHEPRTGKFPFLDRVQFAGDRQRLTGHFGHSNTREDSRQMNHYNRNMNPRY